MKLLACIVFPVALGGCAAYHAVPLRTAPDLASRPAGLSDRLANGHRINTSAPLSLQDIAALAVLNDPDLRAARAQHDISAAELMAAGMPPDPSITGGFAALLGGPGTMPAISGAFTQDIGALITYKADRQASLAGLNQVDAGILWQEWQVASKAEQLAITLCAHQATLASLQADNELLSSVDRATQHAIAANNQTLNDGATSLAALAAVQSALATAQLAAAHDADALDALLGLQPGIAIAIAPPQTQAPPADLLARALSTLGQRRPDLIALRYGYNQADAKLRAAILTQFLPLSVGASGGRDTTGVNSAGPQVTLTLPLFNRNRSAIKAAKASRALLAAQYAAALDAAASGMQSLAADIALLQSETSQAETAARQANTIATSAQTAFEEGQISATSLANLQVAAGERQRSYISLRSQLQSAEISLATLLGLGLPPLEENSPS
jgi:outer membrane protein TolC